MIRTLLVTFAVFLALPLFCQDYLLPYGQPVFSSDSTFQWYSGLDLSVGHSSTAITNLAVDKLLFGGVIDAGTKAEIVETSGAKSRFGAWAEASWQAAFSLPKRPKLMVAIIAGHSSLLGVQHSKDAIGITLYGNSYAEGRQLNISPLEITLSHLQKIGFGLVNKTTSDFFRLNLYHGASRAEYMLVSAHYQTVYSPIDEILFPKKLRLEGELNTAATDFSWGRNWGVGFDAQYSQKLKNGTWGQLTAGVKDLGLVYWKDLSSIDTSGTLSFKGWEDSPFSGNINSENLIDSLTPAEKTVDKLLLLPAHFSLYYFSPAYRQFFVTASADYRLISGYTVNAKLGLYRHLNEHFMAGAVAKYGGFSDLTLLLRLAGKFERWYISATAGGPMAFSDSGTNRSVTLHIAKTW